MNKSKEAPFHLREIDEAIAIKIKQLERSGLKT